MVCWIQEPHRKADGSITAEAVFAEDDPWFDGHFPGEPVLPAVAQLAMAWEAVETLIGASAPVTLAGFRRVKFKEMIRPGQRLRLTAAARGEGGKIYSFKLLCDGRLACTGSLVLRSSETRR